MLISSVARIRPSTADERPFSLNIDGSIIRSDEGNVNHKFSRVYKGDAEPIHIYQDSIAPLIEDFVNGYNICILLFGETGSGKSHTFAGDLHGNQNGLFQVLLDGLFQEISEAQAREAEIDDDILDENPTNGINTGPSTQSDADQPLQSQQIDQQQQDDAPLPQQTGHQSRRSESQPISQTKIAMQFCEIYNEKIRDLLEPPSRYVRNLEIHENEQKGVYVRNITIAPIDTPSEGIKIFKEAWPRRMNVETEFGSSTIRSSAVLTLHLSMTSKDSETIPHKSKLMVVDMPGAEKLAADPNHLQMREGSNLNRSLIHFALVAKSLLDLHQIPAYNKSKLTHLLTDAMGGNSQTLMLTTLKPYETMYLPTILRACNKICKIVNYPIVNDTYAQGLLRRYRSQVSHLRNKIQNLEQTLSKEKSKSNILPPLNDSGKANDYHHRRHSDSGNVHIDELKEHIRKLDKENLLLHDQKEKLLGKIDRLQSRYNEVNRAKSALSSQIARRDDEKDKMHQTLVDAKLEISGLKDANATRNLEQKSRIIQLENEISTLNTKHERQSQELNNVRQELNRVKNDREELIDEYKTLKLNYLSKEHEGTLSDTEKERIKMLEEREKALHQKERASYEETIRRLKDEHLEETRKLARKISELQNELSHTTKSVPDQRYKFHERASEIVRLEEQEESTKMENRQLNAKLNELEKEYRIRLTKYADSIADLSRHIRDEDSSQSSYSTLKSHIDHVVSKLAESYENHEKDAIQRSSELREKLRVTRNKYNRLLVAYRAAQSTLLELGVSDTPEFNEEENTILDQVDAVLNGLSNADLNDDKWDQLREQVRNFALTVQTELEQERAQLLSKYTVASEELEQCHNYIGTQLIKYQQEIIRLRQLINESGGNAGPVRDFEEPPHPPLQAGGLH